MYAHDHCVVHFLMEREHYRDQGLIHISSNY